MKKLIFILALAAIALPSCKKTVNGCIKCKVVQTQTPNGPMEGVTWYETFCNRPISEVMKFYHDNNRVDTTGIVVITTKTECWQENGEAVGVAE